MKTLINKIQLIALISLISISCTPSERVISPISKGLFEYSGSNTAILSYDFNKSNDSPSYSNLLFKPKELYGIESFGNYIILFDIGFGIRVVDATSNHYLEVSKLNLTKYGITKATSNLSQLKVSGNLAIISSKNNIIIIDLSNIQSPQVIAHYVLDDYSDIIDFTVGSSNVYILYKKSNYSELFGLYSSGYAVENINIDTPNIPTLISRIEFNEEAWEISSVNNKIYIDSENGLMQISDKNLTPVENDDLINIEAQIELQNSFISTSAQSLEQFSLHVHDTYSAKITSQIVFENEYKQQLKKVSNNTFVLLSDSTADSDTILRLYAVVNSKLSLVYSKVFKERPLLKNLIVNGENLFLYEDLVGAFEKYNFKPNQSVLNFVYRNTDDAHIVNGLQDEKHIFITTNSSVSILEKSTLNLIHKIIPKHGIHGAALTQDKLYVLKQNYDLEIFKINNIDASMPPQSIANIEVPEKSVISSNGEFVFNKDSDNSILGVYKIENGSVKHLQDLDHKSIWYFSYDEKNKFFYLYDLNYLYVYKVEDESFRLIDTIEYKGGMTAVKAYQNKLFFINKRDLVVYNIDDKSTKEYVLPFSFDINKNDSLFKIVFPYSFYGLEIEGSTLLLSVNDLVFEYNLSEFGDVEFNQAYNGRFDKIDLINHDLLTYSRIDGYLTYYRFDANDVRISDLTENPLEINTDFSRFSMAQI